MWIIDTNIFYANIRNSDNSTCFARMRIYNIRPIFSNQLSNYISSLKIMKPNIPLHLNNLELIRYIVIIHRFKILRTDKDILKFIMIQIFNQTMQIPINTPGSLSHMHYSNIFIYAAHSSKLPHLYAHLQYLE